MGGQAVSIYVEKRPVRAQLGRHVAHDSRSLQYLVPETTDTFVPVKWDMGANPLDQGQLGACVGFATATCLNHGPYAHPGDLAKTNADAISIYSAATRLDAFPGSYPPTDTGSDGTSGAKAAKKLGLISGYLHITTPEALASALTLGPVIVGTDWYESMFTTDQHGNVQFDKSSGIAGGHEYCLDEITSDGRFGFTNSWGTSYGESGRMFMQVTDFLSLLSAKGDATHFVPLGAPAPTPTPPPAPPAVDVNVYAAYQSLKAWAKLNKVV
jgi:hypothetical protein